MALDKAGLKKRIKTAVEKTLPNALEIGLKTTFPTDTDTGDEVAKKFADTVTEVFADSFAEHLSSAIDYYVKTAEVYGTMLLSNIMTVGSPTQHTSIPMTISAKTMATGKGGGSIPGTNTFIFGIK